MLCLKKKTRKQARAYQSNSFTLFESLAYISLIHSHCLNHLLQPLLSDSLVPERYNLKRNPTKESFTARDKILDLE